LIWFNGGHFEIIHRFTTDYASLAAALAKTHFPADSNYVIPIDTSTRISMSGGRITSSQKELQDRERQMQRQVEEENANLTADSLSATAALSSRFRERRLCFG